MNIYSLKRLIAIFAVWATVCGAVHCQQIKVEGVLDTTENRYGAHTDAGGWVDFDVFAPDASQVNLLLYDSPNATQPEQVVPMKRNGTDWRVRVRGRGIGDGLLYMYQADGPHNVSKDDQFGLMFNNVYPLSDPYAYDTQDVTFSRLFSSTPLVNAATSPYAGGGKGICLRSFKGPATGSRKNEARRPDRLRASRSGLHGADPIAR
jgi:Carbohydrate-binding module 48 (Isoamylase N-terminal domain)